MPSSGVRRIGPITRSNPGSDADRPGRPSPARMHRDEADRGASQAACPLADDRDLGPLRPGVEARTAVLDLRPVEVADVERLGVHSARRDGDDPRVGRAAQQREQARQQGERPEDHEGHARLGAVRGGRSVRVDHPGVVDDDGKRFLGGRDLLHGRSNRAQVRHVGDVDREAVAGIRPAELHSQLLEAAGVATHQHHTGAEPRQCVRRRLSETAGRARDEGGLALERSLGRLRPRPQSPSGAGSDGAEARHDGQFQ